MDHIIPDDTYDNLLDCLSGPLDPEVKGWTRRDDAIWALIDAGIFPARVETVGGTSNSVTK